MSVYKHRNSPFWQFDFQRGGYRFCGSTEVPKSRPKREAQAIEAEELRAADTLIREIRQSGRKPLKLGQACARWWHEVGQHLSESDLKKHLDWLAAEIGPAKPLHALSDADVLGAIATRRTHVRVAGRDDDGKQLYRQISGRTVNRTVPLLLRRIVRRARDLWNIVILREPKWRRLLLKETKRPVREITIEEEEVIDAADRPEYQRARRFATIMGLRLKESLLTWPQVDFENAVIRIVGKGDEPAILPLSQEAYQILWAERGNDPMHVFTFVAQKTRKCPRSGKEYVRGQRYPITRWGLSSNRRRHWPVKARYHDLRHTAGMRTLRATGNLKVTQKLLRHSDVSTTAKFYVDALVEDVRAAMEATAKDQISRKESRKVQVTTGKALKA